jgi:hypothetical protein
LKAAAFCVPDGRDKFLPLQANPDLLPRQLIRSGGANAQKNGRLVNNFASNIIVFKFLK